jgi:hypothetical protein
MNVQANEDADARMVAHLKNNIKLLLDLVDRGRQPNKDLTIGSLYVEIP